MGVVTSYTCNCCDRTERRDVPPIGSVDDSARTAGWRIGIHRDPIGKAEDRRVELCPECVGTDEDYWDRRTLTVAYAAGIDAGNAAWGGVG